MLPRISVFLLVYQQSRFIEETIDSIISQGYENLEIVVGDDGSTDGTQDILQKYNENFPGLFKLILSRKNEGITVNSNKILRQCSGDYIALLGGDDLWLPAKLHKQVELLQKNPTAAICHTKAEKFDNATGKTLSYMPEKNNSDNTPESLEKFLKSPPLYVGSTFMVSRWALPDNGFDERLRFVSDWLFLLDVMTAGKMIFLDEILTRYRIHGNNTSSQINMMVPDVLHACDIATQKYPKYKKYITNFRTDWLLVYIHSNRLWYCLIPRFLRKLWKFAMRYF